MTGVVYSRDIYHKMLDLKVYLRNFVCCLQFGNKTLLGGKYRVLQRLYIRPRMDFVALHTRSEQSTTEKVRTHVCAKKGVVRDRNYRRPRSFEPGYIHCGRALMLSVLRGHSRKDFTGIYTMIFVLLGQLRMRNDVDQVTAPWN